ncbi:MAG: cytochrome P450 [Dehalococcoidia bacterium]
MTTPSLDYDALEPATFRDPYPAQADVRQADPLHFSAKYGHWLAMTYELCHDIARDTDRWSMRGGQQVSSNPPEVEAVLRTGIPRVNTLLTADPPEHTMYRSQINRALSARRIAAMEPWVRQTANELIDHFPANGEVEFVRAFSYPLPVYVIAELLGAPRADAEKFKRWSDDSVAVLSPHLTLEERVRCTQSQVEFWAYLGDQLEQRKTAPKDDLLTALVGARYDGERELDIPEMVSMSSQLLGAGHETTTKLLGSAMLLLLDRPDEVEAIRSDPERAINAVEECLRMEAPVQGLFRTAKVDVEIGGKLVKAGERVQLLYASANRDESLFSCPQEFHGDRSNARDHLAFGSGIHYCIGAPLARLEAKVALQQLFTRLPGLRIDREKPMHYEPHYFLRGPKELHLRWDA